MKLIMKKSELKRMTENLTKVVSLCTTLNSLTPDQSANAGNSLLKIMEFLTDISTAKPAWENTSKIQRRALAYTIALASDIPNELKLHGWPEITDARFILNRIGHNEFELEEES